MRLLCLDTSTAWLTVALVEDGTVAGSFGEEVGVRHGELLASAVAGVLQGGRPDAVAVGLGPGPFTSLRVGIATAAALADGWGVPALGACSLDLLAAPGVTVVQDARRKEVYTATYDSAGTRVRGPEVGAPASADGPCVGNGAFLYADVFGPAGDAPRWPDAARLWGLAEAVPLTPLYLRHADAKPAAGPKPSTLQHVAHS